MARPKGVMNGFFDRQLVVLLGCVVPAGAAGYEAQAHGASGTASVVIVVVVFAVLGRVAVRVIG